MVHLEIHKKNIFLQKNSSIRDKKVIFISSLTPPFPQIVFHPKNASHYTTRQKIKYIFLFLGFKKGLSKKATCLRGLEAALPKLILAMSTLVYDGGLRPKLIFSKKYKNLRRRHHVYNRGLRPKLISAVRPCGLKPCRHVVF